MFKRLSILLLVLLMAGCGKSLPDYSYSPQGSDATVVFNSEFDLHTFFNVNINPAGGNVCADYQSAGFILHKDSIFVLDKPNKDLRINVPTDQPVSIQVVHDFNGGNSYSYCGPVGLTFSPEKGKTYLVTMHRRDGVGDKITCSLSIKDAQSMAPVRAAGFTGCLRK